jgi:alpha-tubulin suppressor-like RCC1 family protein
VLQKNKMIVNNTNVYKNQFTDMNLLNIPQELIVNDVFNHLKTIEMINLCHTNKQLFKLCQNNHNVNILQNSLKDQKLACGYGNTYIIKDDKLYGVGSDAHGQLATGKQGKGYGFSIKEMKLPNQVIPLSVASGDTHMIVLTSNGLYGCGWNVSGQLTGKDRHYLNLTLVNTPGQVLQMACDNATTYIITTQGLFYTGYSPFETVNQWTKLDIDNPIMIKTGYNHVAVSTLQGLYIFGDMEGKGKGHYKKPYFVNIDDINDILDFSCGQGYTIILTTTGLYGIGHYYNQNTLIPQLIINNLNVKQISCQSDIIYILTMDHHLYSFGSRYGKLIDTTLIHFKNPIVNVVSSSQHTIALDNQGIYYGHGSNYHKQLGRATGDGFTPCHYFK